MKEFETTINTGEIYRDRWQSEQEPTVATEKRKRPTKPRTCNLLIKSKKNNYI
jgi:hypothetical protein